MITWKIEKRNLSELTGYDKNPRKFTEKGLADLKNSLESLGDANIITINADNTILGGHARATVMNQLGYNEVDVKVPTVLLNEQQIKEVVIRLNANTAGNWDLDMLEQEYDLDDLNDWGLDNVVGLSNTDFFDEEEVMDNDNLQEMNTNKRLALSSMPIDTYLLIKFDDEITKQEYIDRYVTKWNPSSDVTVKTQCCDYLFMQKELIND